MTASVHPAHRAVQISNRNLLIFVLAAFAVLAALVALSSGPYWLQRLSGPQALDLAGLTALTEAELPRYSVAVTGEEMLDTGYEEYTTEDGRRTSTDAYYGALVLGERLLIVRHPQVIQENFTELQGALMMPSGIPAEIIAEIIKEVPEVEASLLPFVLDAVDSSRDWVLGLFFQIAILLVALFGLFVWLRRRNPSNHPVMKALGRYGDPAQVLEQIQSDEMLGTEQIGNLSLSRRWLSFSSGGTFHAARLADVVWVYKMVTQHRTNGIPTGKTYALHVWDRSGHQVALPGKEPMVDSMIEAIFQRTPWAIGGYTDEIQKLWAKDRPQFLAAVEERKARLNAPPV